MFFNDWIGFISESFLFLGMCAALNLNYLRFNSSGNAFNSLFALIFTIILAMFPVFVAVFYKDFTKLPLN